MIKKIIRFFYKKRRKVCKKLENKEYKNEKERIKFMKLECLYIGIARFLGKFLNIIYSITFKNN